MEMVKIPGIDKWIKDLRTQAKFCEFGDQKDLMIRDKIVFSINNERVKERLFDSRICR